MKERTRVTIVLLAQIALGLLAMTACLPSMPSWTDTFSASQAQVQLTFSAYLIAFALAQLIYGPLSDNFGRRRILLVGLAIGMVGTVAAALAPNLTALILARALQGAGTCAGMAIGRAMIQDYFAGPDKTRMMAWVGVTMGFCPPLGTLIGGHIHAAFGWRMVFIVMALVNAAALLAAWSGLPTVKAQHAGGRSARQMIASYGELMSTRGYLAFCLITAFTSGCFYVFIGSAPLVFDAYGVAPENIGWYIMVVPASYIVGNLLTTRLVGRVKDSSMMLVGQCLTMSGIGVMLALALAGYATPLAVALPLVLMGLGNGLLMPPALAGAVGAIPLLAGAAAAMAGMLQQLIGALATMLGGLVSMNDAIGMASLMLALSIMAFMSQMPVMERARRNG